MASRLDDLIREHAERLDQLAAPIELTDVTRGPRNDTIAAALIETEHSPPPTEGRRRWPIVAVAAAAVVIVVGVVMLDAANDGTETDVPANQPTTVAAAERVGFIGLPPVGATTSDPERGQVVLDIASCPYSPYGEPSEISGWTGELTVFADGRLIWLRYADVPEGANPLSTGYLEQRLTPEGVELMRSELLASGLLLPEHQDPNHLRCGAGNYHGHLFDPESSYESPANNHFSSPTNEHIERLTDPASWLPASAWEHREIKAYVPSHYEITIEGNKPTNGLDTRSKLDLIAAQLPAAAEELIDSKTWDYQQAFMFWHYTEFTTEEAHLLAAALEGAHLEQDAQMNAYNLEYHFHYQDADLDTTVRILFRPLLPLHAE